MTRDLDRRDLVLDTRLGHLAATWCAPPDSAGRPVLVCIPGGTYTRGYFDLQVPGGGYSFVEHAGRAGFPSLTVDVLGTGDSARPDGGVTLQQQAAALTEALHSLPDRVGTNGPLVAVGHSMGGYVTMVQQAEAAPYRAVAILGTTNGQVAPLDLPEEMIEAASTPAGRDALFEQIAASMPEPYLPGDRSGLGSWFHLPDVPADALAADATTLTVVPSACAAATTIPGVTVAEASRIDVPVFLAYGELDVSADPHREPAVFTASSDVTLVVQPGSGHCHNLAGTRTALWDRLLGWVRAVAPGMS
ncbi:MAG: alpha/beta hydrolase [Acidimicrobiales bacterium]|nr:alpha/beta hydrolase [Acidimicrobiales bacterium]